MIHNPGRSVAVAIGLTLSAVLLLAGCSSQSTPKETGGGERIRLATMIPPTAAMNPYGDDGVKLSRFAVTETLVRLNQNLEIDPLLASDWEQVDELTWLFTIRDDVTFHDGSKLTPESIKNSLDQAAAANPRPRALNGVVLDVEVTGENELTITTDVLDPLLTNRLASPQLAILSEAAYKGDGVVDPIGTATGPFVLTQLDGTTTATLDRFEDYWGTTAALAGIDVSFVPDGTARAGALRAGAADLAETIPVSQVGLLDESMVNEVAQPRTTIMTLNSSSGPFSDPAVRAAARAAIDPSVLIDGVYEGRADEAVGLLGSAIPWAADLRGDVESVTQPAEVDGIEVVIATNNDRAENPEIAVRLEQQLEAAGFIVTQDVRDYASMEAQMLNGEFDAVIYSRGVLLDTGDPLFFMQQDFSCNGGYNIAQMCDAKVDAIIEKGLQFPVGPERQKATMEAEAAILQANGAIPLVHPLVVLGSTGTFEDYAIDPLERRLVTEFTRPAG